MQRGPVEELATGGVLVAVTIGASSTHASASRLDEEPGARHVVESAPAPALAAGRRWRRISNARRGSRSHRQAVTFAAVFRIVSSELTCDAWSVGSTLNVTPERLRITDGAVPGLQTPRSRSTCNRCSTWDSTAACGTLQL